VSQSFSSALRCVHSGRWLPTLFRRIISCFQIKFRQNCTFSFDFEQSSKRICSQGDANLHMVNFLEYVASEERKRRVSYRGQERKQRKRKGKKSFVSGMVKMPIGSNVAITKSRVLKHLSKNNSVLHKVCSPWQRLPILINSCQ
jgi:hypothetical protein